MLLRIGSTLGGNSMAATVAADVLLFGALLLSWSKDVTFGRSTEGSDVVEGGDVTITLSISVVPNKFLLHFANPGFSVLSTVLSCVSCCSFCSC